MTHTGELHEKIAEQTSKARRSTREVKVPIYFSITAVLLWFKPKGSTKRSHLPNMVEYKGLVGAITSGATTTIRGVGHNLR